MAKSRKLLAPDVERDLVARSVAGDLVARNKLIVAYLPLVYATVARYAGRGASTEDLVSVGHEGLVEGVSRLRVMGDGRVGGFLRAYVRIQIMRLVQRRPMASAAVRDRVDVSEPVDDPEQALARAEACGAVRRALDSLTDNERHYLHLRFMHGDTCLQEDLSYCFGYKGRAGVSRFEIRTLAKMRKYLRAAGHAE